jgi:hypothetical protein
MAKSTGEWCDCDEASSDQELDLTSPTVMFIRHAEKPDHSQHGVTREGEHDAHSLSVHGWTRAGALAALFSHVSKSKDSSLVQPERIIATSPSHDYKSKREHDTALPTAERLGLHIESHEVPDDYQVLVDNIASEEKQTLIIWHHGTMPDFVRSFPIRNMEDVPKNWPADRFDLIWVLSPDGNMWTFSEVAQDLLVGDESDRASH